MYYMGFTYAEARGLPIPLRLWFLGRIQQEFDKKGENGETASRAAHHNTPDIRALQERDRDNVPSRLRRFT